MAEFTLPDEHVLCSYCGYEAGSHREVGQPEFDPQTVRYPEDPKGPCSLNQREVVEANPVMPKFSEAVEIIQSLMEWQPDDLADDEMPQEWLDAKDFLNRVKEANDA